MAHIIKVSFKIKQNKTPTNSSEIFELIFDSFRFDFWLHDFVQRGQPTITSRVQF